MTDSDKRFVDSFESSITDGLTACGIDMMQKEFSLGAAVSGGADSVSLLVSLAHIAKKSNFNV